jgi:hypothetical protein
MIMNGGSVAVRTSVFWIVMPCGLLKVNGSTERRIASDTSACNGFNMALDEIVSSS